MDLNYKEHYHCIDCIFSLVSGTTMGRSVVGNTAWISTTRNTITVLTVTSLLFQVQQWAGVWWETLYGSQLQGALSLYYHCIDCNFSLVSGTTMGRSVVGNIAWISNTRSTITVLTVTSLLFQVQQWAGVWWETLYGSQLHGALSLYYHCIDCNFSIVSGTTMGRSVVGNIAWISTTRSTITVLTVSSLLFQVQQWAGVWWETLYGSQLQGALSLY